MTPTQPRPVPLPRKPFNGVRLVINCGLAFFVTTNLTGFRPSQLVPPSPDPVISQPTTQIGKINLPRSKSGFIPPIANKATYNRHKLPGRGFGIRVHPILKDKSGRPIRRLHAGWDLGDAVGTEVIAVRGGTVLKAEDAGDCGLAILIQHERGISSRYCHLSKINVKRGQEVEQGQVIGGLGSTGLSTAPHLHFEILINGKAQDPTIVMPQWD